MLFDLRSPGRRNLIRVVYAILAVLLGGGLVLFGIGGEGGGFLSDVGGGGGGNGGNVFEDQIDDAEARLAQNPQDTAALAELVQLHYQAGSNQIEVDEESGSQSLTEEGEQQLQQSADAWDRYLKLTEKGGQPPASGVSSIAVQTFSVLADASFSEAISSTSGTDALDRANDAITSWSDAAEAQRILAEGQPAGQAYANLAFFLYRSGDIAGGDQAAARAVQEAEPNERAAIEQQLKQTKTQGEQLTQAIAQLNKQQTQTQHAAGGAAGGNPLEGLGGGGLSTGGGLSGP
jgi:tetratricopeptide (TPR) repeat protein